MASESTVRDTGEEIRRQTVNKFRYEVASEIDVPRRYGVSGSTNYGSAGFKSGYLIQRMIEAQEKQMSNQK